MCEIHREPLNILGVTGFVDELVVTIVNMRIYWHEHPRVKSSIDNLLKRLKAYCKSENRTELQLGIADGCLIHDKRALYGATLSAPRIIKPLEKMGAGGVTFGQDLTYDSFVEFAKVLNDKTFESKGYTEANRQLDWAGCKKIRFLPPYGSGEIGPDWIGEDKGGADDDSASFKRKSIRVPMEIYQSVIDLLQGMTIDVCRGDHFSIDQAKGQIEILLESLEADTKSMMSVARYEQYDAFTFGHSVRVCFLALNFAKTLTDSPALLNRVGLAALLHDIGKARVPFEIVHSRTRLSPEELREIELHTTHGGEILLEIGSVDPMTTAVAFGHHRTEDDLGYPRTPHPAALSAIPRIVKICDVFEALTAVRPYKPGMNAVRAFQIMLSMNNHFDAKLLKRFIKTTGIYPVGTLVKLSSGATARVQSQNEDLQKPIVCLESTPEGHPLHKEDLEELDLSRQDDELCVLTGMPEMGPDYAPISAP